MALNKDQRELIGMLHQHIMLERQTLLLMKCGIPIDQIQMIVDPDTLRIQLGLTHNPDTGEPWPTK